jgi:hypothetical protein
MRSIRTRLVVAVVAALVLATAPALPTLPAWANDDDEIEIKDVGKVKRGEKDVKLRADVDKSDLVCQWKVKYPDGNTDTVGEDESDKDGICEVEFDVPERRSVVGDATIKLRVETKKGADRGKASRNFTVRDRRGG